MESTYFASLQPPAVYRIDSFGILDEVYQAVPEAPSWGRCNLVERPEVEAGSVRITELDASVILGAWAQRLTHTGTPVTPSEATSPSSRPSGSTATMVAPPPPAPVVEPSLTPAPISIDVTSAATAEPAMEASGSTFLDLDAPGEPPPIRFERSVWVPPTEAQIQQEEAQVQLTRQEALSAFRDLAGGRSSEAMSLTWL